MSKYEYTTGNKRTRCVYASVERIYARMHVHQSENFTEQDGNPAVQCSSRFYKCHVCCVFSAYVGRTAASICMLFVHVHVCMYVYMYVPRTRVDTMF